MQPNLIHQGIEKYHSARQPEDIDLVHDVREILVQAGLLPRVLVAYDSNRFIIEAADKSPDVQRFLLNRYWSQQLMSSESTSIEERSCLIPDGSYQDWLTLFSEKILPFLIQHSLPQAINV